MYERYEWEIAAEEAHLPSLARGHIYGLGGEGALKLMEGMEVSEQSETAWLYCDEGVMEVEQ